MKHAGRPQPVLHGNPTGLRSGFTLVELLVVITIIVVLAVISVVLVGRMSIGASAATMSNNLRQIGSAITTYADDNNGKMPGPLHLGQRPIYRKNPPTHLAYHLREYLAYGRELDQGELIPELCSPMWLKKTPTERGISLLSQQDVDPDPRVSRNPWGYANANRDDPNRQPITMSRLAGYARLPWALIEADREHPLVGSAGWRTETAEKPVHGNYRLALYFDGSVAKRQLNDDGR